MLVYGFTWSHGLRGAAKSGFYMPDSVHEFSLKYQAMDGLIVLPFLVNDSMVVNLVLDTGCRNVVLFGKPFKKALSFQSGFTVVFSGLGSGDPVRGRVSLENRLSLGSVRGERIPVVVVAHKMLLRTRTRIDGLIGYDIFTRFEIEIDPGAQHITFRRAQRQETPRGYAVVPLRIVDSKPMVNSSIIVSTEILDSELLIDTGSSMGLLLRLTGSPLRMNGQSRILGRGLNGAIHGFITVTKALSLNQFAIKSIPTGIIYGSTRTYASLGMKVLADYVVVINYIQSYVGLKPITNAPVAGSF